MNTVRAMKCRECGAGFPVAAVGVCDRCFGPLEIVYDYGAIRATISRESIADGPDSLWRYADLLPVLPGADPLASRVDLGAGMTPLVPAPRLGEALGLSDLWIKNDTLNPTNSFKDRVVSVALSAARQLGFDVFACASTGNLAHSVSAHAAKVGMDSYVFIPADLEKAKVVGASVYGANVIAVDGNYDDVNRLCSQIADEFGWAFVNVNVRPFYAEGSKTIGYEIAEQLGWRIPGQVVAPMASGSMYVKLDKAFDELVKVGLVDHTGWRMIGAQARGCSPIAQAFARRQAGAVPDSHDGSVHPVKPDTVAKSLAIGNPADAYYALDTAARTGGDMDVVDDHEIVAAIRLLAETEGIFAETAGGVTIGVLAKLAQTGRLRPDETTVAVISGHGLKTIEAVEDVVGPRMRISARLSAFEDAMEAASRAA